MKEAEDPPPVGKRPKCCQCGKELRPNYEFADLSKCERYEKRAFKLLDHDTGKMRDVNGADEWRDGFGQTDEGRFFITRYSRTKPKPVWDGTFGKYGLDVFCTLKCGFTWATKRIRAAR